MTREEYTRQQREKAVQLAHEMLESDEDLIVKCREIDVLLHDIDEPREEPFLRFTAVVSETDHLPITVAPELLDPEYRQRVLREAEEAAAFFREDLHEAARAVIARYADV